MSFRFTVVETSLNRAEFRWKWLKFLQYSFALAAFCCLLVLILGATIVAGWLTSKTLGLTLVCLIGVVGFLVWIAMLISVAAGTSNRQWLAASLERVDGRLLDRLNTLLFLESRPAGRSTEGFAVRIAKQTQKLVAGKPSPPPFKPTVPLMYLCLFIFAMTGTILLFELYSPWERLMTAEASSSRKTAPARPLDLALPATNNVEEDRIWGEVRITDPGTDIKVTKLDVVPLQIEAAANHALQKVSWFSAVNGAEESQHELPPPGEPRYAVYQPTVYLDELPLTDWDVVTYYAKADTEKSNSYGSEIYFMEVRPFREDILKLPGGEGGKAYQCLNEMSALINRQQQVIRQTHQHMQNPPEQENLRKQDHKKLSEAEHDLGDSTGHLYAKMAVEMENKPIGEALDNLAKAQQSVEHASQLLQGEGMNEAQNHERSGLAELIAARKVFQKAITQNPGAFDEPKGEEETPPVADSSKKINHMAEFRNEARAAQDLVQKSLEEQRLLEQQAKAGRRNEFPRLAEQERQLLQALTDFQKEHQKVFERTQGEWQETQEAMNKAAELLEKRSNDARAAVQGATKGMEKFAESMKARTAEQELADAYKLKKMLDQQIQAFGRCSKPGASFSDSELQNTANAARDTINQLKRFAEQEPTRDCFAQPLRNALTGQNKVDLDARLNRVREAQNSVDKQQRAAEAKDGLSKVSEAFNQSQPEAMQMAQQSDSLKPAEQDSFAQGISKLDSLIRQLERQRPVSRNDLGRQGGEALYNLQSGLRNESGDNDRGNQILLHLEEMLKPENSIEVADLKKLMDELQHFSVETSEHRAKKEDAPEVTNIDPTKLPPAYRGRIQKYFQKLSER